MSVRRLSVVTVSWMTGPRLMESVEAVLAEPDVDEFVLVSHENPPHTLAALRDFAAENRRFVLIETGENLGFSRGCNIGAKMATGDLLLFLNPDAVLEPGAAAQLKASADSLSDRPWLIGAGIRNTDGSEQRGARRGELTPATAMVSFLGLQRIFRSLKSIHREMDEPPQTLHPVPTVSGAAMMMRKDDFETIGGFDERYFLHVEDIDICRMVRDAGGEVWFEPRTDILHYGGTSRSSPLRVETHKASGFVKYFWKFYPGPLERLTTCLLAIPIFGALWFRVFWLYLRDLLRSRLRRDRAFRRLRRRRANNR
jgi:N-acetylglucosaminyl-diphospho-decaprenol L-rhamnosyltransferase